jgi:hypothetical protein
MTTQLDQRDEKVLTAADRCDRCSARAAVLTVLQNGGSLLWCAHHYAHNQVALTAGAAVVVRDERASR